MNFFDSLKENKFIIMIISLIINIVLIFLLVFSYLHRTECQTEQEVFKEFDLQEDVNDERFYVEVKGAVKNPGVYEANKNNIINDIIKLAGGFKTNAYTKNINLSKKVSSELVIYVFSISEYKKTNKIVNNVYIKEPCECSTYDISNCTENKVSEIISSDKDTYYPETSIENNENNINNGSSETLTESNNKININTASVKELITLSGIGESKANDIVKYREENGKFKSIEEIKNVSGIGNALFEKIKDNITI